MGEAKALFSPLRDEYAFGDFEGEKYRGLLRKERIIQSLTSCRRRIVCTSHEHRAAGMFWRTSAPKFSAHCTPVRLPGGGPSLQFGRTSAPIMPHRVHTVLALRSRMSGHHGRPGW
jgi:hypothetical protein